MPELSLFEREVSGAASALALTEVGLGSVIHAFNIPLGGHVLSLNQGFFLSRSAWKLRDSGQSFRAAYYISQISALLKSLSPAGNKLGPMLSIAMQGFLFSSGIGLAGPGLLGISIGMVGLSAWAFIQPFVTLYLFYGHDLVGAAEFYLKKMQESLGVAPSSIGWAIVAAFALKALLAVAAGIAATRLSEARVNELQSMARVRMGVLARVGARGEEPSFARRLKLAFQDMLKPFFLASLLLMGVFFWVSEGPTARLVWILLRPLAVAFLFFYVSRSPWVGRLAARLRLHPRFAPFMAAFDETTRRLRSGRA